MIQLRLFFFFLIFQFVRGNQNASLWHQVGEITGEVLKSCVKSSLEIGVKSHEFLRIFQTCLRAKNLQILSNSIKNDIIEVGNGIKLVKFNHNATGNDHLIGFSSRSLDQFEWKRRILNKLRQLFESYELKIDFQSQNRESRMPRSRRRKDGNMMVSLLVFAMIAVGLIVIPMGFQFLAVLGGKALLLAKLALILSSIQGLKKIATSSFNYGLYSQPAPIHQPWDGDIYYPDYPENSHNYNPSGYSNNLNQNVKSMANNYNNFHNENEQMYKKFFMKNGQ